MPRVPRHSRRQKSLQTIFIETVMFVSLFALIGHLSVNFWERYMIQSEITKMKSSLYAMKDTINDIGVAYDDLHQELIGLVQVVEHKPSYHKLYKEQDKPKSKNKSTLDRKTVHDLEVQVMALNSNSKDQKISAAPITVNQTTQNYFQEYKTHRNATTIAKCLHREALPRFDREISAVPSVHHKNEEAVRLRKHATTIAKNRYPEVTSKHNVGISAIPTVHHKSEEVRVIPVPDIKNVSTITRYPLKSIGVGKDESQYEEMCRNRGKEEQRCCNDNNCQSNFWRF